MAPIKQTSFQNNALQSVGVESLSLDFMKSNLPSYPERIEFYLLMLVTAGEGSHQIDFQTFSLSKGSLVLVKPGQVQAWTGVKNLSAEVVLFEPTALPDRQWMRSLFADENAFSELANLTQLGDEAFQQFYDQLGGLAHEIASFNGNEADVAIIRHDLLGILLRLARYQPSCVTQIEGKRSQKNTYRTFKRLLEAHFFEAHQLSFYAQRLGYADSTISRACLSAEGKSAKVLIDQRVSLEAKRMLVHSSASIAEIAHSLGFSEATNFVKFFRRLEGITPQRFRAQLGKHSSASGG